MSTVRGRPPAGPQPGRQGEPNQSLADYWAGPGTAVHQSGVPWDDPSGKRLREWLSMDEAVFYDARRVAIMPMGFCYPGKGKSGDLPPSARCAPQWHGPLLEQMPNVECVLLIGQYAQRRYLEAGRSTLTERVRRFAEFGPRYLPLPHPSPRNTLWLRRNPWFEADVVPELRQRVASALA